MNSDLVLDLTKHAHNAATASQNYRIRTGTDGAGVPTYKVIPAHQKLKYAQRVINCFVHNIAKKSNDRVLQAFSGSSDLPKLTEDVFNVTNQVNNFDLNWQKAYKTVTLDRYSLSWEIYDLRNAVQFKQIQEGGKIDYTSISGSSQKANVFKYGAGTGITWEMVQGNKVLQFLSLMEQVRSELYGLWADVHYGLLALGAALNVIPWQGIAADTTLQRDIATINKGIIDQSEALKDRGYGDPTQFNYILYYDPALEPRIEAVFRQTTISNLVRTNEYVIRRNIERIPSYNTAIPANGALLVVSGNKLQNAVKLSELALQKKDQDSLNELSAWWSAFGAVNADTKQTFQLDFA